MNRYRLVKAGIDYNEGLRRFANNREMYEKLLRKTPEDSNFAGLEKSIADQDTENAFAYAHALKGVAGNLSLTQLHADLIPLVEELRLGRIDDADELLIPVKASYQLVLEALHTEMQNAKAEQ